MIDALHGAGEYTASNCENLPKDAGAYILLISLAEEFSGRFAATDFTLPAGRYAYCGSANGPGGIAARVSRHFRKHKKPHWHVDQLTLAASNLSALTFPGASECGLVAKLEKQGAKPPLPGFGSSDCAICTAHLLRLT